MTIYGYFIVCCPKLSLSNLILTGFLQNMIFRKHLEMFGKTCTLCFLWILELQEFPLCLSSLQRFSGPDIPRSPPPLLTLSVVHLWSGGEEDPGQSHQHCHHQVNRHPGVHDLALPPWGPGGGRTSDHQLTRLELTTVNHRLLLDWYRLI